MKDNIIIRINHELKEQLRKEAKEKGLTLSSYIKSIVANRNK